MRPARSQLGAATKEMYLFQATNRASRLRYLASDVNSNALRLQSVQELPTSTNLHDLRRRLVLSGYFRRLLSRFAAIARSLKLLFCRIKHGPALKKN